MSNAGLSRERLGRMHDVMAGHAGLVHEAGAYR